MNSFTRPEGVTVTIVTAGGTGNGASSAWSAGRLACLTWASWKRRFPEPSGLPLVDGSATLPPSPYATRPTCFGGIWCRKLPSPEGAAYPSPGQRPISAKIIIVFFLEPS
jgi:hypothetical protein